MAASAAFFACSANVVRCCCAPAVPASRNDLPVAMNVPACCSAALACSCAAAVTCGVCSMSVFCSSCAFATPCCTSGVACSMPFCAASYAICWSCFACSIALLKKSMWLRGLLRRGVPVVHGEDPAQRACVLVELANRPAQPAERGVGTFLRTGRGFHLFDVAQDRGELRLDAVPALAQRRLGGLGQAVEQRRRGPLGEPHAELQPRERIVAAAADEAREQVHQARVHGKSSPVVAERRRAALI